MDALERIDLLVCATDKSSVAPRQYNRKRQQGQRKVCAWTRALCRMPKTPISEEERKAESSTEGMVSLMGFEDAGEADVMLPRTESDSSSHSLLRQGSAATSSTTEPSPWDGIEVPRKLISWGSGKSIDKFLTKLVPSNGPISCSSHVQLYTCFHPRAS